MFLDRKKLVSLEFAMVPTIISTNASALDESAQDSLSEVASVFGEMANTLTTKINSIAGSSIEKNELESALIFIRRAQMQVSSIITGEYNTLSKLVKDTKFEGKLANGFNSIITKSVRIAGNIASFATEAINDFADGIESVDEYDKSEFSGVLVTKLYIAVAKAITMISDVCYDTERLANKLLNGLS